MAKQKGLFQIEGKMGDKSFYYAREAGWQVRSINPTVSERVKKSPEYQNTRLHNGEFGACANLAARTVSPIVARFPYAYSRRGYRYLLETAYESLLQDSTNPAGRRRMSEPTYENYQNRFNLSSKNLMLGTIRSSLPDCAYLVDSNTTLSFDHAIELNETRQGHWRDQGANAMIVEVYGYRVLVPHFNSQSYRYTRAESELTLAPILRTVSVFDYQSPAILIPGDSYPAPFLLQNKGNYISGILIVVKPCQHINNVSHVLMGRCSCMWYSVPEFQP